MSDIVVVVRANMLGDCFGANIMKISIGATVIVTEQITTLTNELSEQLTGKDVFIVGGYYTGALQDFLNIAKSLTVFYNSSDVPDGVEHIILQAVDGLGFASYAVDNFLDTVSEKEKQLYSEVAQWIDEYLYGSSSEDVFEFQNGIYTLDVPDNHSKIALLFDGVVSIEEIIGKGKIKRIENLKIAAERLAVAKEYTFRDKKILATYGSSALFDSCRLLASKTGIGMLVRYNENKQRTIVTCRVSQESEEDAGKIMKLFIDGRGSKVMGRGSVPGILTLEELFDKYGGQ